MPPRSPRRLDVELGLAEESDVVDMCSIFMYAFLTENPKLWQAMYAGRCPETAFSYVLIRNLRSDYSEFVTAFDVTETFDEDVVYGWMSIGIVTEGTNLNSYVASDLSVHLSLQMLTTEARDREDDHYEPRKALAAELSERSADGQFRFIANPHMVVNTLTLWPDSHSDSIWEMAFKLLGWAVKNAEKHDWPIWTQIPEGQARFFRQVGFTEVGAFMLNLNEYTLSKGTDYGTQHWVQMVYSGTSERRARSTSPELRRARRRRPASDTGN